MPGPDKALRVGERPIAAIATPPPGASENISFKKFISLWLDWFVL